MSNIKLLLLEDNELDAELTLRVLKGMDRAFETKVVSKKTEFKHAVTNWSPDLIISDFNLRTFNGDEALAFAKKTSPNTPFIMLSGTITKKMEVSLLEERANDVLTKDNLKRLPYVINRVLNEKQDKEKLNHTLSELAENLKFQEALAEISIRFNSSDSFESKINYALEILGKVADVSRVYLFEDFEHGKYAKNTFEWCAKEVSPQIGELQNVSYDQDIPSWKPHLLKEGRVFSTDIKELPHDLRKILEPQEIKAIIVYPIYAEDNYIGFIGFDEVRTTREWTNSEDKLLKSVSGIISNVLGEKKAKDELQAKNEQLSSLLREKEALVGEVHHRVKNNLALISSFLQLEKLGVTKSDSIEQLIDANIIRVRSIGIVHETVYRQGSFTNIDVLQVLQEIIQSIFFENPNLIDSILLEKPKHPVTFNINTAVPFSLLISEVMFQVINEIKDSKVLLSGEMKISASEKDGVMSIYIHEPELTKVLYKLKKADNFTQVIEVLASQIEAELSILKGGKTSRISFVAKSNRGASSALDV